MKKSFLIHTDLLEILNELTNEQAGILFKAIKDYHNGIEVNLENLLKIAFIPFKNSFERDLEKYNNICERNKNNGLKGGRPKKKNPKNPVGLSETQKTQSVFEKPKKADSDNDSDNDSEIIYISQNENLIPLKAEKKEIDNVLPEQFYHFQLKLIENNDSENANKYRLFVKRLFSDNDISKKLTGVLSIKNQLTYEQFTKLIPLLKTNNCKLSEILLKIENDKKYYKGKSSLYVTLKNWINQKFIK